MAGKGAPAGNTYAAKAGRGIGLNIYLSQADIERLQSALAARGDDPAQWRRAARIAAKAGIQQAGAREFSGEQQIALQTP